MTQTSASAASHQALAESEALTLPNANSLEKLASEIDGAIGSVEKVLSFITDFGSHIPGASSVLGPLTLLQKVLGITKSLLDHVPAPGSE